jgi:hypothetical protein
VIRRWRKRRADSGQAPEVESLRRELNAALQRDFAPRRAREIHGMPASEIASTRKEFEELIRASWPDLP